MTPVACFCVHQLEDEPAFKEFVSLHTKRNQVATWTNDSTPSDTGGKKEKTTKTTKTTKKPPSDDYLNFDSDQSEDEERGEEEVAEEKEEEEGSSTEHGRPSVSMFGLNCLCISWMMMIIITTSHIYIAHFVHINVCIKRPIIQNIMQYISYNKLGTTQQNICRKYVYINSLV